MDNSKNPTKIMFSFSQKYHHDFFCHPFSHQTLICARPRFMFLIIVCLGIGHYSFIFPTILVTLKIYLLLYSESTKKCKKKYLLFYWHEILFLDFFSFLSFPYFILREFFKQIEFSHFLPLCFQPILGMSSNVVYSSKM